MWSKIFISISANQTELVPASTSTECDPEEPPYNQLVTVEMQAINANQFIQ